MSSHILICHFLQSRITIRSKSTFLVGMLGLLFVSFNPAFGQTIRSTFYDGSADAFVRYSHEARFDSSVIMTVEAWIKPSQPFGRFPSIVSHDFTSSFWFGLVEVTTLTARLRFYRSGASSASSTGVVGANRWSHVAAIYDGTQVHFYIDGNWAGSQTLANTGSGVNTPLYIGGHDGGCCSDPAGLSFHGLIDEVRIWSEARTVTQLRFGIYKQLRGVPHLEAVFGTGGLHEDVGNVTGINGGGTLEKIEGMVPHELVVPLTAFPDDMVVDGIIDRAFEYVGGEQMVVRYASSSSATVGLANVHLVHTDTDLYIGIRTISSPVGGWDPFQSWVGFMFDPDYSRDSLAQSTDFRIRMNLGSQARRWEIGDAAGDFGLLFPLPPSSLIEHAVAPCGEFGEQCFELRIAKSQLGEWTDTDGFAVGHLDLSASLDDHLAPGGAIWNAPSTWGTLQYNETSPILPRANIFGTIPEGKCVGGGNDDQTCANDGECPDGDCELDGRTVWLMSPLRDAPLYTTTTNVDGAFSFNDGSRGVLVPPNTTLRVQTEGCLGCLYPDAIVSEGGIIATGIHPLAINGLSVTYPSPCDACSGSCSVGSTCTYPHITFVIRQPPGPTTVTSITPDLLHKEIVLRDSPRKVVPPTRIRIRGENFHEFLDVYLDGNCTSFPFGCDRVPLVIVDRGTDDTSDWLDVELHEDYPSSGVRNITIRDRWVWGRSSGILRGWIHAGPVSWDGGSEYPKLWGFEFANEGNGGDWGDFSNVFGNNAYICLGLPEIDGVCLGCRVPRPFYLLFYVVYQLAIDNIDGNCVGMAATSLLFRHGDLVSSDFTSGVHFPSGLPGIPATDGHIHNFHAPRPGRFGFEACGHWNIENIWAEIRTNHGVQLSAEFFHELFLDMTGRVFSTDGNPVQVYDDVLFRTLGDVISITESIGTGHAITPYETEDVENLRCDGGCNDWAVCTTDADCLPCDETCAKFSVDECPVDITPTCVDGNCEGGCNEGDVCTIDANCLPCNFSCPLSATGLCPRDTIGNCVDDKCEGGCENGKDCDSDSDCPDCDEDCEKSDVNKCTFPDLTVGRCRQFDKIKVYDNNWPEATDRAIMIDPIRNQFRFELGSKNWRGNGIYSIPISVWQNPRTAPGLREIAEFLVMFSFGSADALYTNSSGGEWGWRSDGTIVDAMPGAAASVPLENHEAGHIDFTESRNVALMLPADLEMPTANIHGRGGDFVYHTALGGTAVQLQGFESNDGDEIRVELIRDGDRIGGMNFTPSQSGSHIVPKLGAQINPNESTVFHWLGLHVAGGESVRFDMFPDEFGVGMDNDGTSPVTFYLMVESVDGLAEEHSRNLFGPFVVPAGARHRAYIDDWPVAGFLSSEIDLNRDGNPDQFETVSARSCGGLGDRPALDLNHNGVPDECESGGDTNGDTIVGLDDYKLLHECLLGPNTMFPMPSCVAVDLDFDGDVDHHDVYLFDLRFSPLQQQSHLCCKVGLAGCDDPIVEACVCEQDSYCCAKEWDEQCVMDVDGFACGDCGTSDHKCCETGGPGCDTPAVASCVCAQDPFCCDSSWDSKCVDEVQSLLCGICDGLPTCCSPTGVGCGHPLIESCVCAVDTFCCEVEWDQRCVDLVDLEGCGTCTSHDCCITGGPGCVDPAIEACVCASDPACCNNKWDRLCIEEIATYACGSCGSHDCCEIGTTGCVDAEIQACVCSQDPFCCTEEWDQRCIDEISDLACGSCNNDICDGAEAVEMPANIIGDTTDGLLIELPVCDGVEVTSAGRWYTVMGTGATITASTCNEFVEFDTRISVYEGDCTSLSCVAANDDNCFITGRSSVSFCGTAGVTYRILLHGAGSETGGFFLTINEGSLCNDTCENAGMVEMPANIIGNTTDALISEAPVCDGVEVTSAGRWYSVVGTGATITASTCSEFVDFDTQISVYEGDCASLSCVAANDDNCNILAHSSTVSWCSTPGVTYRILVHGFGNESGGFLLSVYEGNICNNIDYFIHTTDAKNITGNYTTIDHVSTNSQPNNLLYTTPIWYGGVTELIPVAPLGLWYNSSTWRIFNKDLTEMPLNAEFNVVVLPQTDLSYIHTAVVGNISGNSTSLDHPNTNGNPNAIVMVSQYWGAGIMGTYNDAHIGVWYNSINSTWNIFNQDRNTIPDGAKFNVAVYQSSSTAFVHKVTEENIDALFSRIDHPGVNGNPDAFLWITQNWNPGGVGGIYNDTLTGVWYNANTASWYIVNHDLSTMPIGASFNVVIMLP